MQFQYTPYVFPLALAAVISAALTVIARQRRDIRAARPFGWLTLALCEWSIGYALELSSAALATQIFWAKIEYFGIVTIPLAYLLFSIVYTGNARWLRPRVLLTLAVEPLTTLALVWTNDGHGLIWNQVTARSVGAFSMMSPSYGDWFWVHTAYSYALMFMATVLLLRTIVRAPSLYRGQAVILVIGVLAPWVGNALYLSHASPFPYLDLTPVAFTVSGVAFAWDVARHQLLDIVPVARDILVESMNDAMIVLDVRNRIVDANPAALKLLGLEGSEIIGALAVRVLARRRDLVKRYIDVAEAHNEVTLGEGADQRWFDLRISPLRDRNGQLTGRLVATREITERVRAEIALHHAHDELEARVQERTAELAEANAALQAQVAERGRAEQAEHRQRIVAEATSRENTRLFEEEQSRRAELSSLFDLSRALAIAPLDFDAILKLVTRQAVDTIHVTLASVLLAEHEELVVRTIYPRRVLGHKLRAGHRVSLTHLPMCQHLIEKNDPWVVRAVDSTLSKPEHDILFLGICRTVCLIPLHADHRRLGLLLLGEERSEAREPFTGEKIRLARSIGDQAASALRRAELFGELDHAYVETVLALANAVEEKDSYTGDHVQNVARMALNLGRELSLSEAELEALRFGAILHDIGKIGIPDAILKKPGTLTADEWKVMRQHPVIGERILVPIQHLQEAAKIVRHHHERYDGKGYPDGLRGEAIPLDARILTVVDSYSAIIDRRIYKAPRSHEDAVAELRRCAASQFDPHIVDIFLQQMAQQVEMQPEPILSAQL